MATKKVKNPVLNNEVAEMIRLANEARKPRVPKTPPDAGKSIFPIASPPQSGIRLPNGLEFPLPTGLHILAGATGSGKTITGIALVLWFNSADLNAIYISMSEPRSPLGPIRSYGDGDEDGGTLFDNPSMTLEDLQAYLPDGKPDAPIVIISDSITQAIKAFRQGQRSGQSTGTGGIQPLDMEFIIKLQQAAVQRNWILIGIINSNIITFTETLGGLSEGQWRVVTPGTIEAGSRATGREARTIAIPIQYLDESATLLGYDKFRPTIEQSSIE